MVLSQQTLRLMKLLKHEATINQVVNGFRHTFKGHKLTAVTHNALCDTW